MNIKDKFYVEDSQRKCMCPIFEFGNTHRKEIICMYYENGYCHYYEECDRQQQEYSGWDTN